MGLFSMQHHPHHQPQGQAPTQQQQHLQHQQHSRPSSIVHQQHHPQAQSQQHPSYASAGHPIAPTYQQQSQPTSAQHSQDALPYYAHPSPYSTPGATSGYTSADQSDMMAAAQMPRPPYPPMSYHTPQSNSPASVASPSQHDQHRSIYGQPPSQPLQQHMYYQTQQAHYPSMQAQPQQSPYAQHAAQTHQSMSSQPNMMMSAQSQQQQQQQQQHMPQHAAQHSQAQMTNSPRGQMKTEPQVPLQLQKPQTTPMQHAQHPQNGGALNTPTGSTPGGVNPNAAPGPIPATTPLVVRQDQNGVQWIAFEYSRDRVKMEYTIRCDVESVNTDELSAEFKTENCVYPRACCPKDQYRGNRQVYETECNTVGWALAQLNPPLRGKRGLIQRAVDSWRNSNQDPRLRSRRVRRMAKMNTRKSVQGGPHPGGHMGGPSPPGMPQGAGGMGPGGASSKMPGMNMGHMPHANAPGGGDDVGDGEYMDEHHHHHQAPAGQASGDDVRQSQVFSSSYGSHSGYPAPSSGSMSHMGSGSHGGAVTARRHSRSDNGEPEDLFPNIPEAKKRKFILVEDNVRGSRLRVRVTLDGVDTKEIPDSFRKGASVFPRSYFPREMQSPPPSATGSKFFQEDADEEDDGVEETEGRGSRRGAGNSKSMVKVPIGENTEGEVAIPRMRKSVRGKEVRLNDLGYRMAWLQSRVFAGRTVFLQRAREYTVQETRSAIESIMQDVKTLAPHYETRVGKRKWNERMKKGEAEE
ncbi:hypothetical protein CSUB01_00019 [Colletotrichum sublineola]|uniref:DUF8032 domain-containing protein n=1 Tax=Colletotrichum sublineola TaxID=1173701 RepID=A0A066Y2P9_COLSU|nr:hypothetical protein CSUB01_00019 [Colletotrichum sublineola]